jgi:hypothetical protein
MQKRRDRKLPSWRRLIDYHKVLVGCSLIRTIGQMNAQSESSFLG